MMIKERIIKGGLSVMLATSMIMGTLPYGSVEVLAAQSISAETGTTREATKVSGTWGTCNWTIDNGTLTISGGEVEIGRTSDYYKRTWSNYQNDIKKVIISGKIIALKKSLDSLFHGMGSLETIEGINNIDTSEATSMASMFAGCKSLVTLDLSGFDTGKVTTMINMFYGCNSLTTLDVSKFNTSEVRDMSRMFQDCKKLQNIDLSNFNTSEVTNMWCMFDGCKSLTALDVSGFDTSKVTNMAYMFYGCELLTNLNLSNFDTSKVTDMWDMFCYCSSLTALDVSSFDTGKVTGMKSMFLWCRALKTLDISGFDTSKVTDMSAMFNGCSSLTTLDVSGFDTSKVTNMGSMFYGCIKLQNIDVSGFDTSKVKSMYAMFSYYSSLTALDVSNFDTSKVTNMGEMFRGCSSLTALDVSGFDTNKVTNMRMMFNGCSSLTTLDLSKFDISNVKEMSNMFYRDSISLIKLPVKLGNNGETFSNELKKGMTAGGWIDETTGTKYANVQSIELLEGHAYKLTPKGEESSIEEIIENNNLSYSVKKNSAGIQMLTGVGTACKADTLKVGFGKNVVLKSSEGIQLADDAIVGTGCVVELTHDGNVIDTVNVVVKGDTDGTGTIDVLDMEVIQKSILGIGDKLDGAYREAASLSGGDDITVLDMEAIQKDILGIEKIK